MDLSIKPASRLIDLTGEWKMRSRRLWTSAAAKAFAEGTECLRFEKTECSPSYRPIYSPAIPSQGPFLLGKSAALCDHRRYVSLFGATGSSAEQVAQRLFRLVSHHTDAIGNLAALSPAIQKNICIRFLNL